MRGRKLTEADKFFLANLVVEDGHSNSTVARMYNIPHSTVSKYVKHIRTSLPLHESCGQPRKQPGDQPLFRKSKRKVNESIQHIKTKRHHYNLHIASKGDVSLFANYIDENCVELASDGEIQQGLHNITTVYANTTYKDSSFLSYDRNPDSVIVNDVDTRAVERGTWIAKFSDDSGNPTERIKGHYQAGWKRKEDGEWRIISEHYVKI